MLCMGINGSKPGMGERAAKLCFTKNLVKGKPMDVQFMYMCTGAVPMRAAVAYAVKGKPREAEVLCNFVLDLYPEAANALVARCHEDTLWVGRCGQRLRDLHSFVLADVHRDPGFEEAWARIIDASTWPARGFLYNLLNTPAGHSLLFETKAEAVRAAHARGAAPVCRFYLSPCVGVVRPAPPV